METLRSNHTVLFLLLLAGGSSCTGDLDIEGKECSVTHPCPEDYVCLPTFDFNRRVCRPAGDLCWQEADCPARNACAGGVCVAIPAEPAVCPACPDLTELECNSSGEDPPDIECEISGQIVNYIEPNASSLMMSLYVYTLEEFMGEPASQWAADVDSNPEGGFEVSVPVDTWLVFHLVPHQEDDTYAELTVFGRYLSDADCDGFEGLKIPALPVDVYEKLRTNYGAIPPDPNQGLLLGMVADCSGHPLKKATVALSPDIRSEALFYHETGQADLLVAANVDPGQGLAAAIAKDGAGTNHLIGPRWLKVSAGKASLVLLSGP